MELSRAIRLLAVPLMDTKKPHSLMILYNKENKIKLTCLRMHLATILLLSVMALLL